MPQKLSRELGLFSVFSIGTGAMLGPGIFVLPGLAYLKGGPAMILAYITAGILVIPAALSKAEMSTALPQSGGPYLFLDRSVGPLAGTLTGLGTWISLILKSAFSLVGMGVYLVFFLGFSPGHAKLAALAMGAVLIVLNVVGGKFAEQLQNILVVVTIIVLISLVFLGSIEVNRAHYHPFYKSGVLDFFGTTAFVIVSYIGILKITSVAEEIKEPERNIPWGIMLSLTVTILIYALVTYVVVGIVDPKELGKGTMKLLPLAQAEAPVAGFVGIEIMAGVASLALVSMANAGLMAASRFPLPMARDNIVPSFLSNISPRFSTPMVSIIFTGGLALTFIYFLPVKKLAKLASVFLLIILALSNLALIIFRESEIEWYKPSFKAPYYPFTQIFGFLACFSLIFTMDWFPIIGAGGLVGVCLFWYFGYARSRTDRTGALFRTSDDDDEIELFRRARSESSSEKESVIVPFFGIEDADMIKVERRIRIAAALCGPGERLDVVDFVEVPEQSFLSEFETEPEAYKALTERAQLLDNETENEIHVDQVITHNSRGALRNYAEEEKPHWVVLDWKEPSPWQLLIGSRDWWLDDFPTDTFFFSDRGQIEINQILVLTEPGPFDGEVVYAADHIARYEGAEVRFLNPLASSDRARNFVGAYQEELMSICEAEVSAEKINADDWVETVLERTRKADLLIMGGLTNETFEGFPGREYGETIADDAECSVGRVRSNLRSPQRVLDKRGAGETEITDFSENAIILGEVYVDDKDDLFEMLSRELSSVEEETEKIQDALWKRESVQNTYIENGIAFPHGIVEDVDESKLAIVHLADSIRYTRKGESVDVLFVTIGPPNDRKTHLEIIGKLAELCMKSNVRDIIKQSDTTQEIFNILESS